MNRQIIRLTYVALVLVGVLVVMTTYWQTWAAAGLADRQDNAIRRVARVLDRPRAHLLVRAAQAPRAEPRARRRRQDALLPPLSVRAVDGPRRRLLDGGPIAHGARALAERLPDGVEREPLDRRRQGARRAARQAVQGNNVVTTLDLDAQAVARSSSGRIAARSSRSTRARGACSSWRPRPASIRTASRTTSTRSPRSPRTAPRRRRSSTVRAPACTFPARHSRSSPLRRRSNRRSTRPGRRSTTPATARSTASG